MVEDQLSRHAFDDVLTGLPSRSLFLDRLDHAVSRLRRRDMLAVLLMELVRTDLHGRYSWGLSDELLVLVSRRLELCVRPGDTLARLGGNDFIILLEDLDEPSDVAAVAERLLSELARPFDLGAEHAYVGVSIGIGFGTPGRIEAGELLTQADLALHRARVKGENRYVILGPP